MRFRHGLLGHTFSYDGENRPYLAGGVNYYYDGDSERVAKSNGKLYWFGTNSAPVLETDTSGNTPTEYGFFNGKRVAMRKSDGSVHYYFADQVGSADVVTNATGAMPPEQDIEYHPYGEQQVYTDTLGQEYRFTGKERDAESGLDMFGARYYGSSLGRFMTPDWAAKPTAVPYAVFGNPQSLNLYSYVGNNPLMHADPDGHCWPAQSCYQAIADAVNNFSNKVFNNAANSSPAVAALKTFGAGVLASTVKMAASPLTMGTATGTCMGGSGCSAGKTALAVGGDVLKGAAIAAPLASVGGKLAGALEGATETTTLYRAVGSAEAQSIGETGSFSPSPTGSEYKGFFFNEGDAQSFGSRMTDMTGDTHSVVSGEAPTSLVDSSPAHSAATEGPGVLIHNDNLPQVKPTEPE